MSFNALAWAAQQRPGNLAAKMVLLGLANYADEHGCAYPSTAALADFGDMDHKTATSAIDRLIALGLIADTGQRAGRTKQIKVYRLSLESHPKTEAYRKRKPTENGSHPDLLPKDPQKRGTDTVRETNTSEAKASSVARAHPFPCPDNIDAQHWADFRAARRKKRCTDSQSAYSAILRDLALFATSEWPPGRLVQRSAEMGWAKIVNPNEAAKDFRNGNRPANDHRQRDSYPSPATAIAAARSRLGIG